MLSRVAERMYWFGRYLERVENTARLVNVNANLLLDLPKSVKHIWDSLIHITGSGELFFEKHGKVEERNVIRFILADTNNPGSITYSVRMCRENVRTTREIMPSESWEQINELHLFVKQHVNNAQNREGRHEFLDEIINYCNQINGFLSSNMSHDETFNFIQVGMNLERADMTSRIVDVGCMDLLGHKETIPDAFDNILWMNVLRSLSAYQMYKQHIHDRVNSNDVVSFLIQDEYFPRTVAFALSELNRCISILPRNDHALRQITRMQRIVGELEVEKIIASGKLHETLDDLQIELGKIHELVMHTWFDYLTDSETTQEAQAQS